jgi:acetyl esterase/lipase
MRHFNRCIAVLILVACPAAAALAAGPQPIPLWPDKVPGEAGDIGEEKDTTKPDPNVLPGHKDYIIRLGNVSQPTIAVYKPAADKDTGAAVVVCPGGAYSILAMNLEGTEVCEWLNSIGVTGVLLKYRVPARKGLEKHTAALQDVQRAIGMVRHRAPEWKINPERIGVLGFSAGGHLAAAASNNFETRSYPAVDDADGTSCRPDFSVLVYPAYLVTKEDKAKLAPELKVTARTPPAFVAMTQDDPIGIEGVYAYALALKAAKVPCEVHAYPVGGHGYGLRPSKNPVSTAWPKLAAEWMEAQGLLKRAAAAIPYDKTKPVMAMIQPAVDRPAQHSNKPRWFKGNLHTHSLWSDGDDFPERISTWYRDHGYDFLAISDHNTLQAGERWVKYRDLNTKGAAVGVESYVRDYPTTARVRGDRAAGTQEYRLTPLAEYRPLVEQPGKFLLIQSEEVSDKFEKKPIHMNGANLAEVVAPQGGNSVAEVIANNLRAIREQGRRLNRPILAHLNHPNFGFGVTAEEMADVVDEDFFEVFNGHPAVGQLGDNKHMPVERMWDVANARRMTRHKRPPLKGLATDDTHNYHVGGMTRATAGRGWVCVRASELTPEAIIAAMDAGDFYASTGVVLSDVKFDRATGTLSLDIEPDGDVKFTTYFVGCAAEAVTPGGEVGEVLARAPGLNPSYRMTGKELYVRAIVASDRPPVNPVFEGQPRQAWTQPVGWERHVQP